MQAEAVVLRVMSTDSNIGALIQACRQMQLPNPATQADQRNLSGLKHTFAVFNAIQCEPHLTANVIQLGYLIVTWPDEMSNVIAASGGMPHFHHDKADRFSCVIMMGSINQWIDACRRSLYKQGSTHYSVRLQSRLARHAN